MTKAFYMDRIRALLISIALLLLPGLSHGQDTGWTTVKLDDLKDFREQSGNWFIVGSVSMDRTISSHPSETPDQETRKKKRKKAESPRPAAVTFGSGNGILLNVNSEEKKSNLITSWEHGDIELEFEVMLPRESNSGIYLQGRYEVQLFDSWMEPSAKFSDMGGIYRNWETEPGSVYMGKAPLTNAAKAPGLWQTLRIVFTAPRFDASGNKISNAVFEEVVLNGVRIHDHVEVPLPTGGPIQNAEVAVGPIVIQGDHGPVAFRNIRYKLIHELEASLSDLKFITYSGAFESFADLDAAKPIKEGVTDALSCELAGADDAYGIKFNGTLNLPEDDAYFLSLEYTGEARLMVDGKPVEGSKVPIKLSKGGHQFELVNFKNVSWEPPRLAVFVRSSTTHPKALHSWGSYPPGSDFVSPIRISVSDKPKIVRAFLDFKGDRTQRLTHTVAVGDPGSLHYIYDLKSGNLVCGWRGEFLDATPMWHDRGDGSFRPLGMKQYFFNGPSLAVMESDEGQFPMMASDGYQGKGYTLEPNGRPVFHYLLDSHSVSDAIYPDPAEHSLHRIVSITGDTQHLYFKLAEGNSIERAPDGSYLIDGQFYIKVVSTHIPTVTGDGNKALIVLVSQSPIHYSIVW